MNRNLRIIVIGVFFVFLFTNGLNIAFAEELEGVIVYKTIDRSYSGTGNVLIYIDTDGNRTPDYIIWYNESDKNTPLGGFLDSLLERGVKILFDNEGSRNGEQISGLPLVHRSRLLVIDDISVLEWFAPGPYINQWFPYAVRKAERGE